MPNSNEEIILSSNNETTLLNNSNNFYILLEYYLNVIFHQKKYHQYNSDYFHIDKKLILTLANWINAEKERRPHHENNKEGNEESGENSGGKDEGKIEIVKIADITKTALITIAKDYERLREGTRGKRRSIKREESKELEERRIEKKHLEEESIRGKRSIRKEENDKREENDKKEKKTDDKDEKKDKEENEERKSEERINSNKKRIEKGKRNIIKIIEIDKEEDKEEDEEGKSEERINSNKKRVEKGREKVIKHEENVNVENTEGWILKNNSNNENNFLSFEINLMNFLSEEEIPITSSKELNNYEINNKGDEGDENNKDNESNKSDEDDEGDKGEINDNNILRKKSKLKKSKIVVVLRSSFVWNFFITDYDTETDVVYTICQTSVNFFKPHDLYLDITAHWINKEFEICNMVLNIGEIPYLYTDIEISRHISKVLDNWNLEDKIIIIVTDNGRNVKSAVTRLGKDWILCAAHILVIFI
ncbi:hypothetical protein Glove_452g45 [Diversispora epigaea]|uniref:DUF659 domain-containing protein n=1 Tax=Diversispora epigaea TaxID=1348612 RepID=A0A397GPM4_9GLOM|nr:hypothetical protein Glove_452g45 [Diversispora epigaea]